MKKKLKELIIPAILIALGLLIFKYLPMDIFGENILTFQNKHPSLPSGDKEESVFVDTADIAGMEPSVSQELGGCSGIIINPGHYRPPRNYFTFMAGGQLVIIIVKYLYLPARHGLSR